MDSQICRAFAGCSACTKAQSDTIDDTLYAQHSRFNIKENMMRIEQCLLHHAQQTGVHVLWWLICHSWGVPELEWYIHSKFQLVYIGFTQYQRPHGRLDFWSHILSELKSYAKKYPAAKVAAVSEIPKQWLSIRLSGFGTLHVPKLEWYASKTCGFATIKWVCVWYSNTSMQYQLHCQYCPLVLVKKLRLIGHNDVCQAITVGTERQSAVCKYCCCAKRTWAMSHIPSKVLSIAQIVEFPNALGIDAILDML